MSLWTNSWGLTCLGRLFVCSGLSMAPWSAIRYARCFLLCDSISPCFSDCATSLDAEISSSTSSIVEGRSDNTLNICDEFSHSVNWSSCNIRPYKSLVTCIPLVIGSFEKTALRTQISLRGQKNYKSGTYVRRLMLENTTLMISYLLKSWYVKQFYSAKNY